MSPGGEGGTSSLFTSIHAIPVLPVTVDANRIHSLPRGARGLVGQTGFQSNECKYVFLVKVCGNKRDTYRTISQANGTRWLCSLGK